MKSDEVANIWVAKIPPACCCFVKTGTKGAEPAATAFCEYVPSPDGKFEALGCVFLQRATMDHENNEVD